VILVDEGPLRGLEQYVMKVFRHEESVLLNFKINDLIIKLPLEVISKT